MIARVRRWRPDVRYTLMMFVALVATYAAYQAQTAANEARSALAKQTRNRAGNVAVWCNAINQQGSALVAYVHVFHKADPQIPELQLVTLRCARLEQKTIASTKP